MELWVVGTFLPLSLETLGDFLKALLPSQKKKKKGSDLQDQFTSLIVTPLKQTIKDAIARYSQPVVFDLNKREEELHQLHKQVSAELCP